MIWIDQALPFAPSVSIGDDAPTGVVRDVVTVQLGANAVQNVDKPGHPLECDGWRPPVIGDTLWRVDGQLADSVAFICWLVCEL